MQRRACRPPTVPDWTCFIPCGGRTANPPSKTGNAAAPVLLLLILCFHSVAGGALDYKNADNVSSLKRGYFREWPQREMGGRKQFRENAKDELGCLWEGLFPGHSPID